MGNDASWVLRQSIIEAARAALSAEPVTIALTRTVSSRWASVAFDGQQHQIELEVSDAAAAASRVEAASIQLADALDDADLPIAGHALVDLQFTGVEIACSDEGGARALLRFQALTLSD